MEPKKRSTPKRQKRWLAKTPLPPKGQTISMSNALARGAHRLTLAQKRVVSLALGSTDSLPAADLVRAQREGWTVRITAGDFAEAFAVDQTTAYEQMKESCRDLMRCIWTTVDHVPSRKGRIITEGPWLTLGVYMDGTGTADITFHPHIAPHLLALRSQFTSYKLGQAAALRSAYAWRLLECVQSWKEKGVWAPTIEEFHTAMDAPESCRKDFGRLRARVIDPALHELRQKENMLIECETQKAGRKVVGLVFKFRSDPQTSLPL
ncbi:MAG: replication initiation protein [Opitutaceae bacterium]|jgi:plasmid replication initiation protein|nr:replication initiation protein [Opitutaceae bacterium]